MLQEATVILSARRSRLLRAIFGVIRIVANIVWVTSGDTCRHGKIGGVCVIAEEVLMIKKQKLVLGSSGDTTYSETLHH
jgi:hypothetical protein